MIVPTIAVAVLIAVVGWFATIRVISTSSLNIRVKRLLLVPSWIPWMLLALGAPLLSGIIAPSEALNIGGGLTVGLLVAVVIAGRQAPRR
jgi:hypothetical protein